MFGLGFNMDFCMIQVIIQMMIGEYLWKYMCKVGCGEMFENCYWRYFWVYLYMCILYWSDWDLLFVGCYEFCVKSVFIEVVCVVVDDNLMFFGLYRKSLVIVLFGRIIKFICMIG